MAVTDYRPGLSNPPIFHCFSPSELDAVLASAPLNGVPIDSPEGAVRPAYSPRETPPGTLLFYLSPRRLEAAHQIGAISELLDESAG